MDQWRWRKSTRSGANGSCVEVATDPADGVAMRDTKNRGRAMLMFPRPEWTAFIDAVKVGDFDL